MDETALTALRAQVLRFATRRTAVNRRRCREYQVTTTSGDVILVARAFLTGREMVVATPQGHAVLSVVRSRAFPVTGQATVREEPSGLTIGTVTRGGTFRDAAGTVRGRFRDARSVGERVNESGFHAVMEAIFSSDGSMPSGPDALVLEVEGTVTGGLTYGVPPAAAAAPVAVQALSPASRLLPRFLRERWRTINAPRVWTFARMEAGAEDSRLELAAALFTAELSRW